MGDISFPARATIRRESDSDGLAVVTADFDISEEVAATGLPAGPAGPRGRRGTPRATFVKVGQIANAAARPTGLGPDDRGKWWHRLDDNGMDVWTGEEWRHSPSAVGPRGPVGEALSITDVETVHEPELTTPGVQFVGTGAQQSLRVTAPAGLRGPQGPPGGSGTIGVADDFDPSNGAVQGSVFAYHRAGAKFRAAPPPLGAGPWGWFDSDFNAGQEVATAQLIAGTFSVPALPYAWRPTVQGHLYIYSVNNNSQSAHGVVRLFHSQGPVVGASMGCAGTYFYLPIFTSYRDEQSTRTLSPSSTDATVPAGEAATFVVTVERTGTGTGAIGVMTTSASLVVYAQPL
ncbi:hypothetical protein ACWDSJ_13095 [Nocardia sp. NPDC003482]